MRKLISAVLLSFFCISIFPQAQLYSYDESLVPGPFHSQLTLQSNSPLQNVNSLDSENWSRIYTVPGITGTIYATASDGTSLYIGGNFKIAGDIIANSIVKWDGKKWHSLGEGAENGVGGHIPSVEAIAIADGKVFIGGQFTTAGSEEVNGVAYWDGQQWNKLGNDSINGLRRIVYLENDTLVLNGFVYSLYAHKNQVFIGGDFDLAGNLHSKGVAAWDLENGSWVDLNGGLTSNIPGDATYAYDFTAKGNEVIVGGKFSFAGDAEGKNIACWNGTEWCAIGNAYSYVYEVEFDSSGNLYCTGYYPAGDSNESSGIGKWDGHEWASISGPPGITTYVNIIRFYNNGFFAGGYFENDTLRPGVCLAYWENNQWTLIQGLGQSHNEFLPGSVSGFEVINGRLYVTGNFTRSGSSFAVNVAEWDINKASWSILDDGSGKQGIHDGFIYSLKNIRDTIYAGGSFSVAGGVYARNIARWTGNGWQPVGQNFENGIRGSVYILLPDKNTLYVGGYFGTAGSAAAFHVARWDGKQWSPVGIGVGGVSGACVNALARMGDYLYVAGYFSVVGDEENYALPANSIARFNLNTERWETLGRGIEYVYGIPGKVNALVAHENKLFVVGEFHSADDKNYDNVAVLTDNKWSGIDGFNDIGIEGRVNTMKIINGEILIGGQLKPDNEGPTYGILKWEGKKWTPVGETSTLEGEDLFVHDIEPYKNGFIAGGHFALAGNKPVNNIAYFDGNDWQDFEGGISPGVSEMALTAGRLFLAGPRELIAGGIPGISIMTYDLSDPTKIEETGRDINAPLLWNFPNPFQWRTTIGYSVVTSGRVSLSLFDANGKETGIILDEYQNEGFHEIEFDKGDLPAGIYPIRLIQGSHIITNRMVIIQ